MKILSITNPESITFAAEVIQRGELIVIPTDTVYGIACSPYDSAAIDRLYAAKQRPPDKALPVLIADPHDALKIAWDFPPLAQRLASFFWPGALTLTLPKRDGLPHNLSLYDTVAVRTPDHEPLRTLIRALGGALAVSSANRSGGTDSVTVAETVAALGESVALYLDGGTTPGGRPSTVVTAHDDQLTILREGPITLSMLQAALSE